VIDTRAGDQELIIQKSALVFCAVITLLPPLISDADACTCMMSPGNCSSLATVDAVFEATVDTSVHADAGVAVHRQRHPNHDSRGAAVGVLYLKK